MDANTDLQNVLEQSPRDIYQRGVDERMCISGKFTMSWIDHAKIEALVTVSLSTPEEHSFRIFFELDEEFTRMLDFAPNDEFRLSLRGAEVQKLPNIPKLSSLPLQLVFSKGVHIQWQRQGHNELRRQLSTWSCTLNISLPV